MLFQISDTFHKEFVPSETSIYYLFVGITENALININIAYHLFIFNINTHVQKQNGQHGRNLISKSLN
jgi:hypothetical protein